MKTFKLTISSPDGNVFVGDAVQLVARGVEGELAVLAGHIPFITSLKAGECRVELPDGDEKKAYSDGGILTVSGESATLLSGSFRWLE